MQRRSTLDHYRVQVDRAIAHLERHLDNECTLDELAAVAAFSPFHFHRVFRAVTGEGVAEHRRRLRLERAARQLRTSDRAVLDIALDAGYETHESFTRAFEAAFGSAPSRYRVEHGLRASMQPVRGEMPVTVSTLGPLWVVETRHVGPYSEVGRAFEKLARWMGPRGLFGPWTRAVGMSFDDPEITEPARLRYSAGFVVAEKVGTEGDITCFEVPAGEYLRAVHRGPYEKLSETYAAMIRAWASSETGRELADGPSLEFYRNTPENTPPGKLETEVCLKIRDRY